MAIHACAAARARRRQLGKLGERAGKISLQSALLDAREDGGRIVTRRLIKRADAYQPLGIGLQTIQETALARRGSGCLRERIGQRHELAPERRRRGQTGRGERLERGERSSIARKLLGGCQLGREGIATLDRRIQCRRRDGESNRPIAGLANAALGKLGLHRADQALERRDPIHRCVEIAGAAEPRHLLRQLRHRRRSRTSLLARIARNEVDVIGATRHHSDFFLEAI